MSLGNALRERFTDESLNTASGPKVIGLAYDRLDRDLGGSIAALDAREVQRSHDLLVHAQDIVHELLCMLDLDAWEHAESLAAIYRYVHDLLVQANITKTSAPAIEARLHLAELGAAFRTAAARPAAAAAAAAVAAGAPARANGFDSAQDQPRRISVRA